MGLKSFLNEINQLINSGVINDELDAGLVIRIYIDKNGIKAEGLCPKQYIDIKAAKA